MLGGADKCDRDAKYIAPTIVLEPSQSCKLMQEEVFGPILAVVPVDGGVEQVGKSPTVERLLSSAMLGFVTTILWTACSRS